jgi:subtilase family protein
MPDNTQEDDVHQDELIVDRRQRDAVAAVLTDLGVWPEEDHEESANLDLVLLKNLRLDTYAPVARQRYAKEISILERPGREFTGLDVLLYDLRARFAADRGFIPLMGKNRDAVVGFPQHKGFGNPDPPSGRILIFGDAGQGIRVGAVDGPLAPHEMLPPEFVRRDEEYADPPPMAVYGGHATFVAGLIRQAAPGAHIDTRAGLDPVTGMSSAWTVADKIAGFGSEIDILNLSLGCVTADDEPPLVLRRALDKLDSGIMVIAAAGNRADPRSPERSKPVWPAASTRVVAVGAKQGDDTLASFSPDTDWVNCFAPGVDVTSTYLHGEVALDAAAPRTFEGAASWKGTSFAAAIVSGTVAATMRTHDVPAKEALAKVLGDGTSQVSVDAKG